MTTAVATARLTAEEFQKRYADVPFCELVRGKVISLTAAGLQHSRITANACFLIESWAVRTGLGRALTGEAGLITERGPDTVRGVDVAYFSYARIPEPPELPDDFISVAPELAIMPCNRPLWRNPG